TIIGAQTEAEKSSKICRLVIYGIGIDSEGDFLVANNPNQIINSALESQFISNHFEYLTIIGAQTEAEKSSKICRLVIYGIGIDSEGDFLVANNPNQIINSALESQFISNHFEYLTIIGAQTEAEK